jgi:hypothetical protein
MSFQWIRDKKVLSIESTPNSVVATPAPEIDIADEANAKIAEIEKPEPEFDYPAQVQPPAPEKSLLEQHPYLTAGFKHFENLEPMVHKTDETVKEQPNITVDAVVEYVPAEKNVAEVERPGDYLILPELEEESKKKTFMIKQAGQQVIKTKK